MAGFTRKSDNCMKSAIGEDNRVSCQILGSGWILLQFMKVQVCQYALVGDKYVVCQASIPLPCLLPALFRISVPGPGPCQCVKGAVCKLLTNLNLRLKPGALGQADVTLLSLNK